MPNLLSKEKYMGHVKEGGEETMQALQQMTAETIATTNPLPNGTPDVINLGPLGLPWQIASSAHRPFGGCSHPFSTVQRIRS